MDVPADRTPASGPHGGMRPSADVTTHFLVHERGRARIRAWIADGLLPPDTALPDGGVAEMLDGLLALAETLNELPLEGVEPLLGQPRWV